MIKIEADLKQALIRGRGANSNRGAYQNLKSYGGGGGGALNRAGALNRGNTVGIYMRFGTAKTQLR